MKYDCRLFKYGQIREYSRRRWMKDFLETLRGFIA